MSTPTERAAAGVVAGTAAYVLAFGLSIVGSVMTLVGGGEGSGNAVDADDVLGRLLFTAGGGIACGIVAVAGWRRAGALREWLVGREPPVPGSGCLAVAAVLTSLQVGTYLALWVGLSASGSATSPADPAWLEAGRAVHAGVTEELIALALPVVVARRIRGGRAGRPGAVAAFLVLLVTLRLLYHLYYGWWTLSLLPWAVVAAVVYLKFGRVWPLIVEHVAYDLLVMLGPRWWPWLDDGRWFGLVLGTVTAAAWVGWLIRRERRSATAPEPPGLAG